MRARRCVVDARVTIGDFTFPVRMREAHDGWVASVPEWRLFRCAPTQAEAVQGLREALEAAVQEAIDREHRRRAGAALAM